HFRAVGRYQAQSDTTDRRVVRLSAHKSEEGQQMPVVKAHPGTEQRQVERLQALRQQRDRALVANTLADLADQARANESVLPALIESVKAYATVGEICDRLRAVYGVYEASHVF